MSAFPFLGRKKGQPPKLEDVSSGGALRRLGRRLPPIVVGGVPNFPYLFRDSVNCVENVARADSLKSMKFRWVYAARRVYPAIVC